MGMSGNEWIMVHNGIQYTKDIDKKVELLLLRELIYELKDINFNLKTLTDKLDIKEKT